jgi:hypothetical protein
MVCLLRHEIREIVLDERFYFGQDRVLIRALVGIDEALAANCTFYKEGSDD